MKHAKGALEVAAISLEVPYYNLIDLKHKREEDDETDPIILQLGDAIVQIESVIKLLKNEAQSR